MSASVDPTGSAASAASTDSATPAASAAPAASVTAVSTAAAPAAAGPYSQAVSAGSTVYISGQVPLDPATGALVEGGIQAQAERVLTNIGAILEAAGLSYADVVKTTVLLADIADFKAVNEVYARFFTGPVLPARAAFAVAGLPLGARVEIDIFGRRRRCHRRSHSKKSTSTQRARTGARVTRAILPMRGAPRAAVADYR